MTRWRDTEPLGGDPSRGETEAERLDRNWSELLQELRVTQTGVQILFAFLLVLPFQARFAGMSTAQRAWYLAVLALVTLSTVLNLTPVIAHRILFRHRVKDVLMRVSDTLLKWGLAALALALIGGVSFVVEVIIGPVASAISAVLVGGLILTLWIGMPLMVLRDKHPDAY